MHTAQWLVWQTACDQLQSNTWTSTQLGLAFCKNKKIYLHDIYLSCFHLVFTNKVKIGMYFFLPPAWNKYHRALSYLLALLQPVFTRTLPHSSAHEPLNQNTRRTQLCGQFHRHKLLIWTTAAPVIFNICALRCFSCATFCLWMLMTRQCLRGRLSSLSRSLLSPSLSLSICCCSDSW